MKIVNVTPGLLPIPPNGWGAVEKIIWEIHNELLKLGHHSEIKYLDEVKKEEWDIIHIHVANLALEAHKRGIPYYFSFHDHHAYLYGKDSNVYKQNKEAIDKSIYSFVPAKYLVNYFDSPKVQYFSHGVNRNFFKYKNNPYAKNNIFGLGCLANNGYIHNQSEDRKGFRLAIEAAKKLGRSILIGGPSNNKKFFDANPDLLEYSRLKIEYDIKEEKLPEFYSRIEVFVHVSELEAGHPNLTLLEAMSCCCPVISTFEDDNNLEGIIKVNRNVDEICEAYKKITEPSNIKYGWFNRALKQADDLSWEKRTHELLKIYKSTLKIYKNENIILKFLPKMKQDLLKAYDTTQILNIPSKKSENTFNIHFVNGPFIEITGQIESEYFIEFINKDLNRTEYSTTIKNNCWAKCDIEYFINWQIKIYDKNINQTYIHDLDLKDQRVFISLESKSLGDTIAWFPYIDEFRKKHECKIIVSTFHNKLFQTSYPELEFVEPGSTVNHLLAMYTIGWFYDEDKINTKKNPTDFKNQPLQKTSTDILGLEYTEIKPKYYSGAKPKKENKVCIAVHATSQAKYWNNPNGWDDVIDHLSKKGYEVVLLSKEGKTYMGNEVSNVDKVLPEGPLERVIKELESSKLFIGVGSGLSWLAWITDTPIILISGFSQSNTEMQGIRRINAPTGVCSGCFNTHKLDAGDWNWCPIHKGSNRQFECSKTIKSSTVIKEIKNILS